MVEENRARERHHRNNIYVDKIFIQLTSSEQKKSQGKLNFPIFFYLCACLISILLLHPSSWLLRHCRFYP